MSDESGAKGPDLGRQLRQHLDSLRAAGIEWVPLHQEGTAGPADAGASAAEDTAPLLQPMLFGVAAATPPEASSGEHRRQELLVLSQRVAGCTRCAELVSTRTQTVFGVGPLDPELCFVGEAPGGDEDRQGEPFVGAAGQLLNRIIAAAGFKREEVYICNIMKCRPPGNRVPTPAEAGNCREYLDRQLELVRPKFICALGATAAQKLLDTTTGITRLRGRFYDYRGIPVICTFHPAALLPSRSPEKKKDVWEDMKKLLSRMGRPIPGK
jgi:DNA polymerase